MSEVASILVSADEAVIHAAGAVVEWCESWLSLSRRAIEIGLIVGFAVTWGWHDVTPPHASYLIMDAVIVCSSIVAQHLPQTGRALRRIHQWMRAFRIFAISCIAIELLSLLIFPGGFRAFLVLGGMASLTLFEYVLVSVTDGDRGRKRKLALTRLRELFGPSWEPIPEGMPI